MKLLMIKKEKCEQSKREEKDRKRREEKVQE